MKETALKILTVLVMGVMMSLLISCNTGIETTKTIKMSKSEQKETLPDAEELFAAAIRSQPLGEWKRGKRFVVSDNKAALILESEGAPAGTTADSLRGVVLLFDGIETRLAPGGESLRLIRFSRPEEGKAYRYNTGRDSQSAASQITGLDIPMLIDLDMVEEVDSMLRGRSLWTRTRLWYDANGDIADGLRFVPVTVTGVRPGNVVFPMVVDFTDGSGRKASVYMNVRGMSGLGAESRTFPTLFSLSDPREGYKDILPERWTLIQQGKVALGMTKDECRLALGNPAEVDAGHNWSSVIDVWGYKDGTFLQFEDGLLVNYRH